MHEHQRSNPPVVPAYSFEWGMSRWLISPRTHETSLTFGEAWLPPGDGHGRHNHPNSEEILFVLSGEGKQMIDDEEPFAIRPGDTIHVPVGVFHATFSASWEPLRLLVVHAPAGAEEELRTAEGFRELPAGGIQKWRRSEEIQGPEAPDARPHRKGPS